MTKQIKQEEFKSEVIEAKGVTVVDFWAPWCGPCKMLGPVIEELDSEEDDIKFVKVNTDENREISIQYGIASIPTLCVFKDGNLVGKISGFRPKEDLLSEIKNITV